MPPTLTEHLLAAHAAGPDTDGRVLLRPDHVLLDDSLGPLVLDAFERAHGGPVRIELALACAERGPAVAPFDGAEAVGAFPERARRIGCAFSRAGEGLAERIYDQGFAQPGHVVLAAGPAPRACGALGALALDGSVVEAAAALLGGAIDRPRPQVVEVRLEGTVPAATGGLDATLALASRLEPPPGCGRVVEFSGPGLLHLGAAERFTMAAAASILGAWSALFPSDEVTRAWFVGEDREVDWRRLGVEEEAAAEAGGPGRAPLDLTTLEPLVAPAETPQRPRAVAAVAGAGVPHVLIGPGATVEDVRRVSRVLAGSRAAGAVLRVVVAGRRDFERLQAGGQIAALVAAGARVLEGEREAALVTEGEGLAFGVAPETLAGAPGRWRLADVATCAVAAATGRLEDPRGHDAARAPLDPAPVVEVESRVLKPAAEPGDPPVARAFPIGRGLEGTVRGVVLLHAPGAVGTADVLPWGARVQPLASELAALADHAFSGLDPGFAARARAAGGGFVVAGGTFGDGIARDQALLILAELRVAAVLARAWAPGVARRLADLGILALEVAHPAELASLEAGDELEIPGLPEALEPGKPLVVRDLTRGHQVAAGHALDARAIAVVTAGGCVPHAVATRSAAERGA